MPEELPSSSLEAAGEDVTGLNRSQKQHLLSSCQYADKLLSDIESILHASESKSAFPKYSGALAPGQVRVVEDYIARIRAQILRALKGQGIEPPQPAFPTVRSLRVALIFAAIAFEECTADKMRGYGEVPAEVVPELNGLVDEIKAMLDQLSGYLGQDLGQDPGERLRRLQQTGDEIELLKKLELVITQHGLVDYRGRLSAILDRVESKSFEIALFGRVSSGKSSLLNHIVGFNILPVGVNPITAVPTRIVFGPAPRLLARVAGQNMETFGIERIPEFVTEQQNPANRKRIERLIVEFPSERLKDGVVLVDTPGLGSLASAGAAETLAYLPRCDLGVVLIDASSTLTAEDLSTVQALNEAAIETIVLLSKADLLAPDDVVRASEYIGHQIHSNLGLELPLHAVSVQPGFTDLLDRWFTNELAPRYQRHQELTRDSLRRKIGALRDAVSGTLRARLDRATHSKSIIQQPRPELIEAETQLRHVTARFEEIREQWYRDTLEIREYAPAFLREAANRIVTTWSTQHPGLPVTWESLTDLATALAAAKASGIRSRMEDLARDLSTAIRKVSELLGDESASATEDLTAVVKEMPRIDLGSGELKLEPPWIAGLSTALAKRRVEKLLQASAGDQIKESFSTFGSLLDAWSVRVSRELQLRFNRYADALRAQLARLSEGGSSGEDASSIRTALNDLGSPPDEEAPETVPLEAKQ
jgi:GTP-binding protein EngB required for normal cell division